MGVIVMHPSLLHEAMPVVPHSFTSFRAAILIGHQRSPGKLHADKAVFLQNPPVLVDVCSTTAVVGLEIEALSPRLGQVDHEEHANEGHDDP